MRLLGRLSLLPFLFGRPAVVAGDVALVSRPLGLSLLLSLLPLVVEAGDGVLPTFLSRPLGLLALVVSIRSLGLLLRLRSGTSVLG